MIDYIPRSRDYYSAQGYAPYQWAHFEDVPFCSLNKPLSPKPDLRISHIGYDRKHCDARDPNTWLPIDTLTQAAETGVIGDLAPQLIGVPTNRSQRATLEQAAPRMLDACRALSAEVALLVQQLSSAPFRRQTF